MLLKTTIEGNSKVYTVFMLLRKQLVQLNFIVFIDEDAYYSSEYWITQEVNNPSFKLTEFEKLVIIAKITTIINKKYII
jgi:hypothetical protein